MVTIYYRIFDILSLRFLCIYFKKERIISKVFLYTHEG